MARFLKSYFSWIWVGVVVSYGLGTSAYGNSIQYRPTLVFRIVNDGQVTQEVVEVAKAHVEWIYGHSGIQVEWFDGDEANAPSHENAKLDLTMVFIPESVAQAMIRAKDATGFAVSNDGQGARRAYIFVERVEQQAAVVQAKTEMRNETKAKGLILGQVMAHEAGHLMLPHDAHSTRGIMQARQGMDSVEKARRGILVFTPDQSKLIRTVISRSEAN